MTLLQRLKDLEGCAIVHVDEGRGLVVFWTGRSAFLEYTVQDGRLVEAGAWSASKRPKLLSHAQDVARTHYGLPEL